MGFDSTMWLHYFYCLSQSWCKLTLTAIEELLLWEKDLTMWSQSVSYKKLEQGGETSAFDYSSAFTYESTDPHSYKSAFKYGSRVRMQSNEYDIQKNRGWLS